MPEICSVSVVEYILNDISKGTSLLPLVDMAQLTGKEKSVIPAFS